MHLARELLEPLLDEQIERVVSTTLEALPRGATHWSTRRLAPSEKVAHRAGVGPPGVRVADLCGEELEKPELGAFAGGDHIVRLTGRPSFVWKTARKGESSVSIQVVSDQ